MISSGTVHRIPKDLKDALSSSKKAVKTWEDITPLARNEWICWNITVKNIETRKKHIERTVKDLAKGKRRPCCWMGCPHRKDKQLSKTQEWILGK